MHKTLRTCKELLEKYQNGRSSDHSSEKLHFILGEREGKDVYNITAPFWWNGEKLLAGRVESRDSENSEVIFFSETEKGYEPVKDYPVLNLQDPFVAKVDDLLVVGGVEIFPDPDNKDSLCWRTVFYKGKTVSGLKQFAKGPDRMKDIRLLQLRNGKILVAVRPQGSIGGRGKIGFTVIDSLEELDAEHMEKAQILEAQFIPEEWGGCNELHLLEDDRIGVLSHIACFDAAGNRHYYSSCFIYHVDTGEYSPMKLIAVRDDFQAGACKRPDLRDVIFSGGLVRRPDGTAELYCGVSDAEAHRIIIQDPFIVS